MKLHGRITVFGEYLLKDNLSYSLCLKSNLFLSNEDKDSKFIHSVYDSTKDKTIPLLKSLGVINFSKIYGNLPLCYGLSSSTILSMLHLNTTKSQKIIALVDKEMNGFSPSELDYTSILKQSNGIFGFGKWQPLTNFEISYSLLIIPKEGKRNLIEVQQKISKSQDYQIDLTKKMYNILSMRNELEYDLIYKYCKLLLSCQIYSGAATEIATDLIAKGISCKCIGGLYDKALLVIHSDSSAKVICDKYILDIYNYVRILE